MAQATCRGRFLLAVSAMLALAVTPTLAADRTASLQPEQVRMVQRSLQDWGYPVALSGTWDDATRAAVSSFQSSNQLPATGSLDAATSRELGVDPWAATPVSGRLPRDAGRSDRGVDCAINNTVDCLPGQ